MAQGDHLFLLGGEDHGDVEPDATESPHPTAAITAGDDDPVPVVLRQDQTVAHRLAATSDGVRRGSLGIEHRLELRSQSARHFNEVGVAEGVIRTQYHDGKSCHPIYLKISQTYIERA